MQLHNVFDINIKLIMDFKRLKDLARKFGVFLVLDDGEPSFVVMPFDEYQKLDAGVEIPVSNSNGIDELGVANGIYADEQSVDRLNQEIRVLKEERRQKEEAELLEKAQPTEATAETIDLD